MQLEAPPTLPSKASYILLYSPHAHAQQIEL